MLEHVTGGNVSVSPAEVQAYYEDNYVAPSQQAYQDNIDGFEQDVLYYGGVSYYIPAGYRYVRHILLPASAEDVAHLQAKQAEIDQADEEIQTLENAIHGLLLLGDDATQTQAALDAAQQARDELTQAYQAIIEEIAAEYQPEVEAIQAALESGTSFDTLLKAYNQDTLMPDEGYMICAQSTLWSPDFRDGAMALAKPGDVSEPVHTAAGVHFFEYTSDAPAGAVALTGELEQAMTDEALLQKKYNALAGFVAQWRQEYQVFTDAALLDTPPCLQ